MDTRNTNRYTMLLAVQQYLDAHTANWTSLPIAATLKNELDALLAEIAADLQAAGQTSTGLTQNKNTLKAEIAQRAARYAGAMKAYATINGNDDLAAQADKSRTYFLEQRDADFAPAVQGLLDLLTEEVLNLADYGVTEAQLTELSTSLDDYRELVGSPRQRYSAAHQANREAEEGVQQGMDLLNNRMDPVMLMFEDSDPGFYNGYRSARVIVD